MAYIIMMIGWTFLFTAVFFGVPYFIHKKFDKNFYVVSIIILSMIIALFLAMISDFATDPRGYGYIPEDDVTVYDVVNNNNTGLGYFGY